MLGKLIKHDFRAFMRTLLPLQLGVLGAGILAAILARLSGLLTDAVHTGGAGGGLLSLLSFLSMMLVVLLVIAVVSTAFITLILICTRMQKSFFSDEGYLTFSLPVTTDQLLWSKIITGTIWMLINAATIFVTLTLFGAFGTADGAFVNADAFRFAGNLFSGAFDLVGALFTANEVPGMWLMTIIGLLDCIAFVLLQVLALYFAVIAGGRASQKHKLLAAIGIYLLVSFVLGCVLSVVAAVAAAQMAVMAVVGAIWFALAGVLVILLAISAGLYFWMRHLLKHRLNLQ